VISSSSHLVLQTKQIVVPAKAATHNHQRLLLQPSRSSFCKCERCGYRCSLMRSLSSGQPEAGRKYFGNHVVEPPGTTRENRHSPCDEEIEKGVASQNVTVSPDFDLQCWTQADQSRAQTMASWRTQSPLASHWSR
jgi:hypothetical protein